MRALPVAALLALAAPAAASDWAIAIHGSAGVIERGRLTADEDAAIRADLGAALEASPWFNAGVGAVLTAAGTVELDAAVMDGRTRAAGAVTGVATTQSPVALARTLMDKGPHVFLAGSSADAYAHAHGLPQVPNAHFITNRRRRQLDDLQQRNQGAALAADQRFGTVGAVARNAAGRLAAATSTGGLTGKAPGRVGDAPLIGAGTLADDRCIAVSATGSGEMFIRARVASQICDRIRFGGKAPGAAAQAALAEVKALGGEGGVILLAPTGEPGFAFNSAGMYRGRAGARLPAEIAIYADE